MKKNILKSLFVSVLCMLAASCQDTEFAETLDSSKAQVMFSIAMDSPAARSHATWGEKYSPSDLGDEYDNRIDLNQFIVKIEAGGKTYNVTDIIKWKEGETNEHKFVGIVKTQNGDNVGEVTLQNAKISVYANMGNDANANFATMTFNQDAENIPMWGALTVENLKFTPGERASVNDIYLLRAMAKFQVTLGEDVIEKGYTLTKASLNKFNLVGNNMPTGFADATSTMALGLEEVMNENTSNLAGATELTIPTEDGNGWVIYLPEISNTTDSELKMLLTFSNGNNENIETEVSVKDYTTANKDLVNIVRNHWYKYVIEDIVNAKPVVKYKAIDWTSVNINVGGEGFLALSTDLVEIFNANTGQLQFTSSSPITIRPADVYEHMDNGVIEKRLDENSTNPLYAYYISKFGQKVQLGTDPGFDVEDKENVLAKEVEILKNISATCNEGSLNGDITINSPFIGQQTDEYCNYNTIRYIEFLVTNEDGLSATFRVMQYPPIVITNEEGYFSYRSDQKLTLDQKEASHYHNYIGGKSFHLTGLYFYHEHEWSKLFTMTEDWWNENPNDRDYSWAVPKVCPSNTQNAGCETVHYGHISNLITKHDAKGNEVTTKYGGVYRAASHPDYFLRWRYSGISYSNNDSQGLSIGSLHQKEDGKWYIRHYVWNVNPIFYNLYVDKVYKSNDVNANRLKGQADIHSMTHPTSHTETYLDSPGLPEKNWVSWGRQSYTNHRMYNIRVTSGQGNYVIGYPALNSDGTTQNIQGNGNMLSPNFVVASQLGETRYQSIIDDAKKNKYTVPDVGNFYKLAEEHCREYVETSYKDLNGNGKWDQVDGEDEPVTHYDNWRLPTKAEIDKIIELQETSRAMDKLLVGQYYFCITGNGDDADTSNPENWVSSMIQDYTSGKTGYYIRCVRDVKGNK